MTTISTTSSTARIVAAASALALAAAACGGSSDDAPTAATTTPATTAPSVPEAQLKPIDPAALQAIVDETAEDLLVPGLLVLLRTPQGEFTAASGTTKLGEQELPSVDTHFRIASITKTMTSATILLLAQEGKLSLDDPVSKYIPEVPDGDNITLAQLLEMRSGLYSFTDDPVISKNMDDDPTRVWKPQELLDIAFAQPAMFAPGSDYYYSNTNYVLLGLIIEELEGRPIAEVFEDRLFEPLGMDDTMFAPLDSHTLPEPYAHGYLYGSADHVMLGTPYTPEMAADAHAGTLEPKDFTDINHSFSFTAGAVISTGADLATWIQALGSGKVLDAEYQQIWQASAKIIDPDNSYNWYGYGIDQLRWGPNTIDLHGGQTPGFNSEAVYDPANDMSMVIWANLTMSVEGQFTAVVMMLKVLDEIYSPSPVPATTTTTSTPP